jgi:transposase, IS5 family
MIRYTSERQLPLDGFLLPFGGRLSSSNRWVKLSRTIPWDDLVKGYHDKMNSGHGRPAKNGRLVIGAVIIKHKLNLSDEETVLQIQENPYLQYFVGFSRYHDKLPFVPSLFVEIRRRMGSDVFDVFEQAIFAKLEASRSKKPVAKKSPPDATSGSVKSEKAPRSGAESNGEENESVQKVEVAPVEPADAHQGKLIIDATVANQAIKYPTDIGLLNEAREISERLIDDLARQSGSKKPRTYREQARARYLILAKNKKPGKKLLRKGLRQQLQYLRRNLSHIDQLLDTFEKFPFSSRDQKLYWVIQQVYSQQREMYQNKTNRCDDRIVSISQPHVRPIVRGKAGHKVEFGAKISVSLVEGVARVDNLSWDAFNEGQDLEAQVENYKSRYGCYPEVVLADGIYGTRENRKFLKAKGIRFGGKPLGRPKIQTELNAEEIKKARAQRKQDARERIPIEGKFGQGKNGYRLNYIRARTVKTSEAWIRSIFMVMNLLFLSRIFHVWRMVIKKCRFWQSFLAQLLSGRLESESLRLSMIQQFSMRMSF